MTKTFTADEVRALMDAATGHPLTTEDRASLFIIASAYADRIEAAIKGVA